MSSTEVSLAEARRIAVHAQALDGSATGVLETVRRLGFLQLDPISTVAPPQHLVLWSRLGPYDRAELDRLLWEERKLFEYDAFVYPIEDLPVQRARMRRYRRERRHTHAFLAEHARVRRYVLRELERNGPLLSRAMKREVRPDTERHTWWGNSALLPMLEILAGRGEIAVAGRVGTHRLWDLAERVYPETETIPWREAERQLVESRRRSLGVWLERGRLRAHQDGDASPVPRRLTFLSPFDRLVHDRNRAEAIWGFRYRLEMYVPRLKREYGYYVLPILNGDRVVGRIEPVFDRRERVLRVNGVWWEDGVRPGSLGRPLRSLARFLGAERIEQ